MASIDLLELRNHLETHNALLSFSGLLSESIIKDLGDAIRNYLAAEESPDRAQVSDVFSVFIEQTQNIRQYAGRVAEEADRELLFSAISVIARDGDYYVVGSGNWVRDADLAHLTSLVDELNNLDAAGLKKRYKSVLRAPTEEGADTAGLGLIDMARKARYPLAYSVRDSEKAGYSFFSLQATL